MVRDVASVIALVAVLFAAPLAARPSPYFLLTPGGAYEIGPRLQIPAEDRQEAGRMAFTAVYAQDGNWIDVARARLAGTAEIVPADEIQPPGMSQQQVNEVNQREIDESKPVAAVVALRAAGYRDARVTGNGAEVRAVIPNFPADGILQPGDVIHSVDGEMVETAEDLVARTASRTVGEALNLQVERSGDQINVQVTTRGAPEAPDHSVIGITVTTYQFDAQLPFPVAIESDNVGGSSAGLMFALAILDAVTPGDLTRGHFVAGTGTLAIDGTVGAIGGAAEKAIAAKQEGADVFLVPRSDFGDVGSAGRGMTILPVDTFQEAVAALCGLSPTAEASATLPTPCS